MGAGPRPRVLAGHVMPVEEEPELEKLDSPPRDPESGIAPGAKRTFSQVVVPDVEPADEPHRPVDDRDLSVVAVVDPVDRGKEDPDLPAGVSQFRERLPRPAPGTGSHRVEEEADLDALPCLLREGVDDRPPQFVVVDDEVLQVDVVACPPDRGKERVELILTPGVEIDPVPPGQERSVVLEEKKDRLAELLSLGGGEPVVGVGKLTVLLQEDLLQEPAVLLPLDDKHLLPGVVLPEEQIEYKADRRQGEEDHQPGQGRRRVPPLEEDDGDGKYDVEDQDDGKYYLKGHSVAASLPEPGMTILSLHRSISVCRGGDLRPVRRAPARTRVRQV